MVRPGPSPSCVPRNTKIFLPTLTTRSPQGVSTQASGSDSANSSSCCSVEPLRFLVAMTDNIGPRSKSCAKAVSHPVGKVAAMGTGDVRTRPGEVLRPHAEVQYAGELAALARLDDRERPPSWRLSPWAVVTYLMGGELADGTVVIPKYVGRRRLMEIAVATLATDRALLLLGVPGTAKTWVSEHLSAAISGDSTLLVQGTAGTTEETLRYGWNYARLLAEGPSEAALVPSPVYRAMQSGSIVRVEELTRMPSDVQDALVTVLSEKTLPVPELAGEVQAVPGFNLIATANDRDRGINDLSAALRRRFNTVVLPLPADPEEEIAI